ncbi:MAG: iron ABC transporter permease [Ignavibacteriales bacterium]|nr:iron ABC transporter permease [Ignavibacteriales bacterium]
MEANRRLKISPYILKITLLFIVTIIAGTISLLVGSVSISLNDLFHLFFIGEATDLTKQIVYEVRLPRVLLAIAVGGGLSVCGAVFQAILMNPLAEPYILGISSGAAFGAVLSMVIGAGFIATQVFSFLGAISVIFLVFLFGKRFGELEPNVMLLSGVMIGAFFSAVILVLVTFLNESLRTAVFWLMGHLSIADAKTSYFILPVSIIISFILSLNGQKYNVLSLGSATAQHLGINTSLLRNVTYILSSLLVGVLVSVSGIIGFVGLLIPHICRMIFGVDNRIVIPASFLIGASYLALADSIARVIIAPAEIPVGAITALIGAPIFIYLLRKRFKITLS